MADYIYCRKKFISPGENIIENITSISIDVEGIKRDLTLYLKQYGKIQGCTFQVLYQNTDPVNVFLDLSSGNYYIEITPFPLNLEIGNTITLIQSETKIYTFITEIQNETGRIYLEHNLSDISGQWNNLFIFNNKAFNTFKELYTIIVDPANISENLNIPIIMPVVLEGINSLTISKNIFIHVDNSITQDIQFTILPGSDNFINSYGPTEPNPNYMTITYKQSPNITGYKTYVLRFISDGENSWFVI